MIPKPDVFFLEYGLFNEVEFTEQESPEIFDILFYKGTIDAHCPKCEKDSVLTSIENFPKVYYDINNKNHGQLIPMTSRDHLRIDYYGEQKFILKEFKCSRCSNIHQFNFEVFKSLDSGSQFFIKKTGQCFSIADYQNHDIKKYRKVLGKDLYAEFSKGVGLFSHGVGIGAFVYLRRIIEQFVIQEAYTKESENGNFDKQLYEKSRVKERIELLKNSLPDFLVANKALYSILSKGIHELSEQECLDIFPVMKTAIEYILDEVKAKKELEEKKKQLSDQISKINKQLGKAE